MTSLCNLYKAKIKYQATALGQPESFIAFRKTEQQQQQQSQKVRKALSNIHSGMEKHWVAMTNLIRGGRSCNAMGATPKKR